MQTAEPSGERTSASGDKVSRNRDSDALRLAPQPPASASWRHLIDPLCPCLVSDRAVGFACAQSPSSRFRFYEEQLALADENLMQAKEVWSATLEGEKIEWRLRLSMRRRWTGGQANGTRMI